MKLSQRTVDAQAADTDRVVWDDETPGLGLRVQNGRRSWIVRYRIAGAQRQKSLPGNLPLKKARIRAAEIRTGAQGGADIIADGRATAEAAKREAEASRTRTLGAIVEKYLADAEKRLRPPAQPVARLDLPKAGD